MRVKMRRCRATLHIDPGKKIRVKRIKPRGHEDTLLRYELNIANNHVNGSAFIVCKKCASHRSSTALWDEKKRHLNSTSHTDACFSIYCIYMRVIM